MSSTRHAPEGEPLRQERYMSSAVFVRGLMGNVVARRCELLDSAAERELVWFLQLLSHRDGGISGLAAELRKRWPERVATQAMQRLGLKWGQVCSADQVRQVRREIPRNGRDDHYRLRGESTRGSLNARVDYQHSGYDPDGLIRRALAIEDAMPDSYPADDFFERCGEAAEHLPGYLEELCLNPEQGLRSPWFFPSLVETLREHQAAWIAERSAGAVTTEIGRQVNEALDYALVTGRMVLIDGMARTGKTTATRTWCEQHPGRARYVQVPSSNDESGFFRALAKSLGVSVNLNSKAVELRDRVEDTLQRSRLMVVLDEAHYLMPQGTLRDAMPTRINWLMTALVNHGVPVALVTTPQFIRSQKRVEQKSCWTSEQFTGRIGHYARLPDTLDEQDLAAVARVQLPEGDAKSLALLVAYARSSAKYLAGIDSVVTRARYLAERAGRSKVTRADVAAAIQEGVIPSDNALSAALADVPRAKAGTRRMAHATPAQAPAGVGVESRWAADRAAAGALQLPGRLPASDPQEPVRDAISDAESTVAVESTKTNRIHFADSVPTAAGLPLRAARRTAQPADSLPA